MLLQFMNTEIVDTYEQPRPKYDGLTDIENNSTPAYTTIILGNELDKRI